MAREITLKDVEGLQQKAEWDLGSWGPVEVNNNEGKVFVSQHRVDVHVYARVDRAGLRTRVIWVRRGVSFSPTDYFSRAVAKFADDVFRKYPGIREISVAREQ